MPVPIRSVLVASDLTESSDEVLRAAGQVATFARAELHVVHVQEPVYPLYPAGETVIDMQKRLHEASDQLAAQLRRVGLTDTVASSRVEFGSASGEILKRGGEVGASLIVIGPHRQRRVGDRLLGTTADRLIRSSEVPCLIVRGPLSLPLRRVLMATDFSEPAQAALREAFQWAVSLGSQSAEGAAEETELRVVHVLQLVGALGTAGLEDKLAKVLHEQVEAARKEVPNADSVPVQEEVIQHASASEVIAELASGADLVVLATHGRTALGRALIGSVSSAVSRDVERSVLLVPPGQ